MGQVYIPQDMNYPALRLDVDRVHAGELGLSQKDVVDNVITALNSNLMIAPNYWVDRKTGNDYFLTVQYFENGPPAIHDSMDLKNIPLRGALPRRRTLAADPSFGSTVARERPWGIRRRPLGHAVSNYLTPKLSRSDYPTLRGPLRY